MLLFLVVVASLQTLQGTLLPLPHAPRSVATAEALSGVVECRGPDSGGPQCRTVYAIMYSCLLTIFACVWTSAHLNINGPRDSGWTCLRRKMLAMFIAVTAPEAMLYWALHQRSGAKEIARQYNRKFATSDTPLGVKVVGWFQRLPKETTWRGDGQPWTITHGFFIQMGGFILYDNGYPKEVLTFERLTQLLHDKAIYAPTVTERELQDRSKGDTISKAIVVLQTSWFVLQCIARAGQHLPLSELEVLTLAFAVVNTAIYAAWWNKPQGVDMGIRILLKRAKNSTTALMGEGASENLSHPTTANLPRPEYHRSNDNFPLIAPHEQQRDESANRQHSWLPRKLREDYDRLFFPYFLFVRLPYRIVASMLHFLGKLITEDQNQQHLSNYDELRVPVFYTSSLGSASDAAIVSAAVGIIFGASHLLAWGSKFPSHRDLVLWHFSAVIMIMEPLLLFLALFAHQGSHDDFKQEAYFFVYPFFFLVPVYIAARCILIVIALQAIWHPPNDVLRNVSWTSYIPHF